MRAFALGRAVFRYLERLVSHDVAFRLLARLRVRFYAHLEPLAPAGLPAFRRGDLLARLVGDVDAVQDLSLRFLQPVAVAAAAAAVSVGLVAALLPSAALVLLAALLVAALAVPAVTAWAGRRAEARLAGARADLTAEVVALLRAAARPDRVRCRRARTWTGSTPATPSSPASPGGRPPRPGSGPGWPRCAPGWPCGARWWSRCRPSAPTGSTASRWPSWCWSRSRRSRPCSCCRPPCSRWPAPAAAASACSPFSTDPRRCRSRRNRRRCPPPVRGRCGCGARPRAGPTPPLTPRQRSPASTSTSNRAAGWPWSARAAPGKSTLAAVLLRFVDLTAGRYCIGGCDARAVAGDDVRRVVGLCAQDAHVFDSTIRENLRLARPGCDDAALRDALHRARLLDWVDGLPHGLDTDVGERGVRMSAGERQRLALARALLADFPVLVLDEPTANLDPPTAAALTDDLLAATEGRSVLLITHRLHGLEQVDEIIVMHAGRVVERGTQAELLRARGRFSALWSAAGT